MKFSKIFTIFFVFSFGVLANGVPLDLSSAGDWISKKTSDALNTVKENTNVENLATASKDWISSKAADTLNTIKDQASMENLIPATKDTIDKLKNIEQYTDKFTKPSDDDSFIVKRMKGLGNKALNSVVPVDNIKKAVNIANSITDKFDDKGNLDTSAVAKGILPSVIDTISPFSKLKNMVDVGGEITKTLGIDDDIAKVAELIPEDARNTISSGYGTLTNSEKLVDLGADLGGKLGDKIKSTDFADMKNSLTDQAKSLTDKIQSTGISDLTNAVGDKMKSVDFTGMKNSLTDQAKSLGDKIQSTGISDLTNTIGDKMKSVDFTGMKNSLTDQTKSLSDKIQSTGVPDLTNTVEDKIKSTNIEDLTNSAKDKINSVETPDFIANNLPSSDARKDYKLDKMPGDIPKIHNNIISNDVADYEPNPSIDNAGPKVIQVTRPPAIRGDIIDNDIPKQGLSIDGNAAVPTTNNESDENKVENDSTKAQDINSDNKNVVTTKKPCGNSNCEDKLSEPKFTPEVTEIPNVSFRDKVKNKWRKFKSYFKPTNNNGVTEPPFTYKIINNGNGNVLVVKEKLKPKLKRGWRKFKSYFGADYVEDKYNPNTPEGMKNIREYIQTHSKITLPEEVIPTTTPVPIETTSKRSIKEKLKVGWTKFKSYFG